jgi:alkylation response protein AidB-like acyl-CoA dehydrogenase
VVAAEPVALDADACLARGARWATRWQRTRALAAVALAAEQVGVAQQCLDLTVAYTQERQQFGRRWRRSRRSSTAVRR